MTAFFLGLTLVAPLLEFAFLAADAFARARWTSLAAEWQRRKLRCGTVQPLFCTRTEIPHRFWGGLGQDLIFGG